MKGSWTRKKPKLYFYSSSEANAEIFGAPSPLQRWAWSVYWERGHDNGTCATFAIAKYEANQVIAEAERSKETR